MWVEIMFRDATPAKRYENVRNVYEKIECLSIELDERDADGNPIIRSFPWLVIFWWDHPHLSHVGASPRKPLASKRSGR